MVDTLPDPPENVAGEINLSDYQTKQDPGFTHQLSLPPLSTSEKVGLGATIKMGESIGYAALAASPTALNVANGAWMLSWLSMGHSLREDVRKQVQEGKKLDEISLDSNPILKMLGDLQKSNNKPQHVDLENERTHFNDTLKDINNMVNPKFDWKQWIEDGPLTGNVEDRTTPEWDTFNAATIMGHPNPEQFNPTRKLQDRKLGKGGQLP